MWSRRFTAWLESFGAVVPPAAAGPGRVHGLTVGPGTVTARVEGGRDEAYEVRIGLPEFGPAQWERLERAVVADESAYEQILDGDLPDDIDGLFARTGLPLFPATARDLAMECGCPDWVVPCEHLAAALRALAAAFDEDPFRLLEWRGRDRAGLLRELREMPSTERREVTAARLTAPVGPGAAELPLAACLDTYWLAGEQPGREPDRHPPVSAVSLLDPPAIVVRGHGLAALLAPAYEAFMDR